MTCAQLGWPRTATCYRCSMWANIFSDENADLNLLKRRVLWRNANDGSGQRRDAFTTMTIAAPTFTYRRV